MVNARISKVQQEIRNASQRPNQVESRSFVHEDTDQEPTRNKTKVEIVVATAIKKFEDIIKPLEMPDLLQIVPFIIILVLIFVIFSWCCICCLCCKIMCSGKKHKKPAKTGQSAVNVRLINGHPERIVQDISKPRIYSATDAQSDDMISSYWSSVNANV